MTLTFAKDATVADWIVSSATPFDRLVTFGPRCFEAYARLRFIPDPTWPGQAEADAIVEDSHLSDLEQTQRALRTLEAFTRTPRSCYFCVWDGTGDIVLPMAAKARYVALPHRRYALFHGVLTEIERWSTRFGPAATTPPAFVWPEDRAWCFASDVDPHWAGIGGSQAAIDALVSDEVLDVVSARPDEVPPAYQ